MKICNNRIGALGFLNQHCALAPNLESILRARMWKIVLQHNLPKADLRTATKSTAFRSPRRHSRTPAISPNGSYGTSSWACRSLRLDVGGPDDVAPLLRLVGDELAKVGGREREHVATQVGKPHLDLGVGEARVDLPVELVDDFSRRVFWCADALPAARFIVEHKFAHGRDV